MCAITDLLINIHELYSFVHSTDGPQETPAEQGYQ